MVYMHMSNKNIKQLNEVQTEQAHVLKNKQYQENKYRIMYLIQCFSLSLHSRCWNGS